MFALYFNRTLIYGKLVASAIVAQNKKGNSKSIAPNVFYLGINTSLLLYQFKYPLSFSCPRNATRLSIWAKKAA